MHWFFMKLTRLGICALSLVALLLWSGCGTDRQAPVQRQPCSLDELRLGDDVTVTFIDLPTPPPFTAEQKIKVKEDGTISLPYNVSVPVAGKKVATVEKEIEAAYVPKYFVRLSVSVKTGDRTYWVGGEVKLPARQVYLGPTTLIRAIQSCGDFTDFANRKQVKVQRADGTLEVVNAKKAIRYPRYDVPICPGDAIIVPRRTM